MVHHVLQVKEALAAAKMDFSAPTFILSECVLVYMRPDESTPLVEMLASTFDTAALVVRPHVGLSVCCTPQARRSWGQHSVATPQTARVDGHSGESGLH
jgi:O-methyltransferase involved in polyketide biosynthesis